MIAGPKVRWSASLLSVVFVVGLGLEVRVGRSVEQLDRTQVAAHELGPEAVEAEARVVLHGPLVELHKHGLGCSFQNSRLGGVGSFFVAKIPTGPFPVQYLKNISHLPLKFLDTSAT